MVYAYALLSRSIVMWLICVVFPQVLVSDLSQRNNKELWRWDGTETLG